MATPEEFIGPPKPPDKNVETPPAEPLPADAPPPQETPLAAPPAASETAPARVARAIYEIDQLVKNNARSQADARADIVTKLKLSPPEVLALDEMLAAGEENGEDGSTSGQSERLAGELKALRDSRKNVRYQLTQQYGEPSRVPGAKGFRGLSWIDKGTGTAYIVSDDGDKLEVAVGGKHNFGTKEAPVTKKWDGSGWVDVTGNAPRPRPGRADAPPGAPPAGPPQGPDDVPEPLPPPPGPPRPDAAPGVIPPPPPSWEERLDIKKFKRVRDTGPGHRWAGGFGTPRRFFYVLPDAPRNPDGSQRRFTEEEYQELKRQVGGRSPGDPTVGRLHRGADAPDRFAVDTREFIGVRPKSLREIAANERDQMFFGELLANLIPGKSADLLARAYQSTDTPEGALTAQERKIILYAQYEYSRRLAKWEKMSAKITGKHVEQAIKRDPALEAAVRLNDSEGNGFAITAKIWKEELMHLAMRDVGEFDKVHDAQMKLAELHETRRFKNWDGRVDDVCKRMGVDHRDYDAVFKMENWKDRAETRKYLKLNVQKDLTGFGKVAGALGITAFKVNRAMKEADLLARQTHDHWASPTSWTLRDVNKHEGTLARVMALTIGEPEKLRALTKAAMRNEEMQLERDAGPRTRAATNAEYATAARGELSTAKLQEMFNRAEKPAGYGSWSTAQREDWRDNTWNPSELHPEGEQKRVGLWAQIFSKFKDWLFNNRKKEISVA